MKMATFLEHTFGFGGHRHIQHFRNFSVTHQFHIICRDGCQNRYSIYKNGVDNFCLIVSCCKRFGREIAVAERIGCQKASELFIHMENKSVLPLR